MRPERWKRTEELYHAARARAPGERAAFLVENCRDDEAIRADVESLLAESDSDADFLDEPLLVMSAHMVPDSEPAAMAGRSLGVYRLQTLLGAGGMGEVYKAHDTKLGRDVAIKILPRAFTSDPDRLARFEREARMLASLNHPNICAIYGLEEADGIRFLILELVDGETLADKLAPVSRLHVNGGQVPLGDALAIARQIADALEVAHERGVVHRDLKPANVKITPGGVVKVLDFGLAKTVGGDGSSPELTHAPAPTCGEPRRGAVIGTAAYMSPEQARGLPVDKRTDIWAFACVLYEMLAGRVAFAGETMQDSIAKILEREPDWSALPATTPASVRRLLLRCLVKEPKNRLRDIGDVRIEIDAIDGWVPGQAKAPQRAIPTARRAWLPWIALVALAATVAGWGIRGRVAIADNPPFNETTHENPLVNARFTTLTNWPGTEEGAELSPDGRFVAFLADKDGELDLWWAQVDGGEPRNLTRDIAPLTPGILRTSGFSGDGSELWFDVIGATTLRMPQTGGTPRPFLAQLDHAPAWSPDGGRLVYFTQRDDGDRLSIAVGTGADARQIEMKPFVVKDSTGISGTHNHNPVWSSDGQWIYFVHGAVREWNHQSDEMDIWRISPSGGSPERLTHLNAAVTFLAPLDARTLLFVAPAEDGAGSWLWSLDVASRATRRIISGLEQYTSVSASRDGRRIVATKANPTSSLWTVPILAKPAGDRDAQPYPVKTERALAPRFGGTSLFYLSARGTGDGLWRFKEGTSVEILNGADAPLFEPPAPSHDGSRVAVVVRRNGTRHLSMMFQDGTGSQTLATSINIHGTADWSPDGNWIVTGGVDTEGPGLFKIPVNGGGSPIRLATGQALNPIWSPDGGVIVYAGPFTSGQVALFGVRPDATPVELPSVRARPSGYRFLPNGTGLVYLPRPESPDFWLLDLAAKSHRRLTILGDKGRIRAFDITPDGQHIVFDRVRQNSDIVLIDVPKK